MEYFAPLRLQLRLIRADFIAEHNVMNLVSLRICMEADIRRNLLGSADFQLCSNNKDFCHLFFIGCILSTHLLKT
ncbi:unknown [Clostridium sp. CAG:138]|nr:unknown [Clostridium sp. CAG:138]